MRNRFLLTKKRIFTSLSQHHNFKYIDIYRNSKQIITKTKPAFISGLGNISNPLIVRNDFAQGGTFL